MNRVHYLMLCATVMVMSQTILAESHSGERGARDPRPIEENRFDEEDLPYLESADLTCVSKISGNASVKQIEVRAKATFIKEISKLGTRHEQGLQSLSDIKVHFRGADDKDTLVVDKKGPLQFQKGTDLNGSYVRNIRLYLAPYIDLNMSFEKNGHFDSLDLFLFKRQFAHRNVETALLKVNGKVLTGDLSCHTTNEKILHRPLHAELYSGCERKRIYQCAGKFTSEYGCMAFQKSCVNAATSGNCFDYHLRCRDAVERDFEESIKSIKACCKE